MLLCRSDSLILLATLRGRLIAFVLTVHRCAVRFRSALGRVMIIAAAVSRDPPDTIHCR